MSIIITSCKPEIKTLQYLPTELRGFHVVVSREFGVGLARNVGAEKCGGGLLVFLDDDLNLHPKVADYIVNVAPGEFAMTFLSGFPCSRVLAIHSNDFFKLGGFDDSIRFTGEDRDFFVRAVDSGLRFKPVPIGLVHHIPHPVRASNIHVAVQSVRENVLFLRRYWRSHPEVFKVDVWQRLKRGQARTLLLEAFWFFYLTLKEYLRNE